MFLRYNIFTLLWAGIILFLSVIPDKSLPSFKLYELFSIDKLGHIFFYSVLVFLMAVGFKKQYTISKIRYFSRSWALGISIFYGIIIEVIQGGLIYRNFDIFDILANIIGCLAGTLIFTMLYYKL